MNSSTVPLVLVLVIVAAYGCGDRKATQGADTSAAPTPTPTVSGTSEIAPGSLRMCLTTEQGLDTLTQVAGPKWTSRIDERYKVFSMEQKQKVADQVSTPYKGAAVYPNLRWAPKSTLRVRFLNGDQALRSRTMQTALQWSQFASVKLAESLASDAELRVWFTDDNTSRSRVGRQAPERYQDVNKPTMWLGQMSIETPADTFSSIVLHEFGHALGLIHEHQHPSSPLDWNEPLTIKYFRDTYEWKEADVRQWVFRRERAVLAGRYDSLSIMHYPFPGRLTYSGRGAPFNLELSKADRTFMRQIYP